MLTKESREKREENENEEERKNKRENEIEGVREEERKRVLARTFARFSLPIKFLETWW